MEKCDSNMDVRKECKHNELFEKEFIESIRALKELLEDVLGNICSLTTYHSLFSNRLKKNDINSLGQVIGESNETFWKKDNMNDLEAI